ncbi:MAG: hypothetical protein LBT57_03010 [Puniceicoccales bacterium]|jgi:hypothetical protein|nr:hypothetical protein [Puniceicoccales bacterium]
MDTTSPAGWSISSSADAFWIRQLEAWQAMQNEEFNAAAFFSSGAPGIVLDTPRAVTELEYEVPTLDPATFNPAGVAAILLILSAVGQDLSLQTQMEGLKISNEKNIAHREDNILKLQQKIQKALYKTPWERLTNWMKHSFWGKFITCLIKVITMIIALTAAIAASIASFGAAAPMLAFTIAACCLMTAEMATDLATDGKSIGENIAEKVTKNKAQAQKIAMAVDITWMALEMGCAVGAAATAPTIGASIAANTGFQAAEKTTRTAAKVAEVAQKIEKVVRYVQAAYTLIDASIKLGYAISQSELIKMKASAEAERSRMEAFSEWIQEIIEQYMQQIAETFATTRDAYERASKVIQEQAEVARLIAANLRQ